MPSLSPCQFYVCSGLVAYCPPDTCNFQCPNSNPKPASLNATCSGNVDCHAGSNKTACDDTAWPTRRGCCENHFDLCAYDDCSQGNLTISYFPLGPDVSSASSSMSTNSASVPGVISTSQGSATSTSVSGIVPAATPAGQSALHTATPAPKSNTAAIAGGVVGGVVGLALLIALLAIYRRRRTSRPLQDMDEGRSATWDSGVARSSQPNRDAELEEIKQGQSPISPPSASPPPPRSPLPSPSPRPPAYAPYSLHRGGLESSADLSQPSDSSPSSHDLPFPESPPSPPPLESGHSEHTADRYSDEQSVSPISTYYQNQPFGDNRGPESSRYSEVSSSELLHTHSIRS